MSILPSRWQDGAESLGIERTSCIWQLPFSIYFGYAAPWAVSLCLGDDHWTRPWLDPTTTSTLFCETTICHLKASLWTWRWTENWKWKKWVKVRVQIEKRVCEHCYLIPGHISCELKFNFVTCCEGELGQRPVLPKWLNYVSIFAHLQQWKLAQNWKKFAKVSLLFCQIRNIPWKICPRLIKYCQSCEILPDLVTLPAEKIKFVWLTK